MPKGNRKQRPRLIWPDIEIGDWSGEFAGSPSGSIGQSVQPGPPLTTIEFTYLIVGASVVSPVSKFRWPAIVAFWVPTILKPPSDDVGSMFKSHDLPSLNLSFEITRNQYSDICWMFREKLLKDFHFSVLPQSDSQWLLKSWGAGFEL
jgi:hypothetical protein